jgi:Fe-S oxidoreductase
MGAVNVVLGVVTAVMTVAAVVLVARTVARMVAIIRLGQADPTRTGPFGARFRTMLVETLGHTRMLQWSHVGVFHWLVMVGFGGLFLALVEAYGEVWNPRFHLPLIGQWGPYSLLVELLGLGTVLGIVVLAIYRQVNNPRRTGRASRFYGSHMGRAYFVEAIVFIEGAGILLVRAAKSAIGAFDVPTWSAPVSLAIGSVLPASPVLVSVFATLKIFSATVWLAVIALQPTMGVAWHRFTAFPNIYFKRGSLVGPAGTYDGYKALGALKPMMSGGRVLDLEEADPDTDTFGAGRVEDFTWKGILDFTTCTECGRCQSQCPAWNTGKPLSPKLLVTALRDHTYAKAPYLLAGGRRDMTGDEVGIVGEGAEARLATIPVDALREAERPLVGGADLSGVIDPDVLWSCTSCGACVQQCPVDIEHVDHIVDMRRYQVMIETEFPSELASLFKNLENKGNPWGQNARNRLDWTKNLPFDVPVFDGELSAETEYLYWIGCAGAFDDKAQKTVRATAELLHRAGVNYVVLGTEETCTGDPARRSGNEFLFQMMAQQTAEMLNTVFEGREPGTRKIVTTCPHCFNTLGREYPQLEGHYEVVHHTQLLNSLVRDGKLVPVAAPEGELADVTYHDPCYLGRHNEVYSEPRALVGAAGATLAEMPRHADRSFCCGAGGARMWMEEKIGRRINLERVDEALGTGAEKIATGCPFCRVMLSDGLTQRQSEERGTDVEILDVSQLLLAAVKRGDPPPEKVDERKVDALGGGAPGVETTPLSGTQANGKGPADAVTADSAGDVSVGGGSPGGASTKGVNPDAASPPGEHPGGG